MAIPTSRTKVKAEIKLNQELCRGCGVCVSVCKDFSLELVNKKVAISDHALFGCMGCGHCMAICPNGAIEIHGRYLSPADLFDLPPKETNASYEQLMSLYMRRRSLREFKDKAVEPELIQKILSAAQTAPMGLPPSDVNVLIFDTKEKVLTFAKDYCKFLDGMKWFVSNWFLTLMRPFWGKANDEMFRGFIKPLFNIYTDSMAKDINLVNYDAPLAMYFYGSPYTDPADPIIAATYAMTAAETLGLGDLYAWRSSPIHSKRKESQKVQRRARNYVFQPRRAIRYFRISQS